MFFYATTPTTGVDLEAPVREAIQNITPRQLVKVMKQTTRRVRKCIEVNGQHFENLVIACQLFCLSYFVFR